MAEHQKMSQKKPEEEEPKRPRRKKAEPSFDQLHAWEPGAPITETPFQPRIDAHSALLAKTRSDAQRANLVMRLQQTYGNRYVQRLLDSMAAQAKLTVSQPGDIYEQEADRVADMVTKAINPQVQRQAEEEEEEEEVMPKPVSEVQRQAEEEEEEVMPKLVSEVQRQAEEEEEEVMPKLVSEVQRQAEEEEEEEVMPKPVSEVQRQAEEEEEEVQMQPAVNEPSAVPENLEGRINAARGSGQPISEEARVPMEQAFGADFSGVRVHTDSEAHGLSESLQARAFTTGQDIFFKSGEYSPGSDSGRKLIAHELTHVVQQGGGKNIQREDAPVDTRSIHRSNGTIQRGKFEEMKQRYLDALKRDREKYQKQAPRTEPPEEEVQAPAQPEAKAPTPSRGAAKLKQIKPRLKKAPPVPTGFELPSESPLDPFISKMATQLAPLKEKCSKEESLEIDNLPEEMQKGWDEYRLMKIDTWEQAQAKMDKTSDILKLATNYKKVGIFGRIFKAIFKKKEQKAVDKLEKQIFDSQEVIYEAKQLVGLKESCQDIATSYTTPVNTLKELKAKIDNIYYKRGAFPKEPEPPVEALASEVEAKTQEMINQLEQLHQEKKEALTLPLEERVEKEKKWTEFFEREKKERGLETADELKEKSLVEAGPMLEALDPKHREAKNLIQLLSVWLGEKTPLKFFTWVTRWEALNYPLKKIKYITDVKIREKYKLWFKGLQIFHIEERESEEGTPQKQEKPIEKGIYVMTPGQEFYASNEDPVSRRTFHHSSFLAGLPVGAAGEMKSSSSKMEINLESGHYQPTMKHMVNAVEGLDKKGVPLEKVRVSILSEDDEDSNVNTDECKLMSAADFREGLRALKAGKDPAEKSIFGKWLMWLKRDKPEKDPKKDPRVVDATKAVS